MTSQHLEKGETRRNQEVRKQQETRRNRQMKLTRNILEGRRESRKDVPAREERNPAREERISRRCGD